MAGGQPVVYETTQSGKKDHSLARRGRPGRAGEPGQDDRWHPRLRVPGGLFRRARGVAEHPTNRPDVVLMDINLPGMLGTECVQRLKAIAPDVPVLMLTVYDDSEQIFKSLMAGATGYLLKRTPKDKLLEAIREITNGGAPMSRQIARRVVQYFQEVSQMPATPQRAPEVETLTEREGQVLSLLAKGGMPTRKSRPAEHQLRDRAQLRADDLRQAARPQPHRGHAQIPRPLKQVRRALPVACLDSLRVYPVRQLVLPPSRRWLGHLYRRGN